jgi:hypothetical protein
MSKPSHKVVVPLTAKEKKAKKTTKEREKFIRFLHQNEELVDIRRGKDLWKLVR